MNNMEIMVAIASKGMLAEMVMITVVSKMSIRDNEQDAVPTNMALANTYTEYL